MMTALPDPLILPTGTANLASVKAAFTRLGTAPRLAETAEQVTSADRLVIPGVGTFGAALERIHAAGLFAAVRARLHAGAPTLGFCVGLQLMAEASEESPGIEGLGLIPATVGRFPEHVTTPQFGWNHIDPDPACRFLQPGYAYFANSYRLVAAPGAHPAFAEHGGCFVAAFEKGAILGCQFHPELSGPWGQALLERWLMQ